ncbi:hypothetical protein [Paracidovorax avenae]|uniref:hypothetical protein n=1 Tax=Paracidovorax avenae TaxID=80867 RepID=UPI0012601A7E|nr:hypothetical protein [Paracidovorax avenae]
MSRRFRLAPKAHATGPARMLHWGKSRYSKLFIFIRFLISGYCNFMNARIFRGDAANNGRLINQRIADENPPDFFRDGMACRSPFTVSRAVPRPA